MKYDDLLKEINEMPASQRPAFHEIVACAGVGGDVWPTMKQHLEDAHTLREFLDAVYDDDACRFEKLWGLWARLDEKDWRIRFKAEMVLEGALIERGGVVFEAGDTMFLVPVRGIRAKDRTTDILVFADDGFNTDVADFYGSISGPFTLYEQKFEGTFDIYRAGRNLILERWEFDELGFRKRRRSQVGECCSI